MAANTLPMPLLDACGLGDVVAARLLIDRVDVNEARQRDGETALLAACAGGHFSAAKLLLDRGAEINQENHSGSTPLHAACRQGGVDVVRLCLLHGAEFYFDHVGSTPLHVTCYYGKIDAARELLKGGADVMRGIMTAYDVALDRRLLVMAAWLRQIDDFGWKRHLAEPRYKLVVLRALSARGDARRKCVGSSRKEQLLDFLFPGERPKRQTTRHQLRLPDDLFSLVARYYWGGGLSAAEEAAHAAELVAAAAREEDPPADY